MPDRATYEGRTGVQERDAHFAEMWGDDLVIEAVEFIDAGNGVVITVTEITGHGEGSGAPIDAPPHGVGWRPARGPLGRMRDRIWWRFEILAVVDQENVDVVRGMWEAFLRSDLETALAAFAPDVEWDGTNLPDGTISQGLDAVVDHATRWAEMWETWEVELEEVIDVGHGRVIAFIRERGRTQTGLEMNERHSELYTVRDGKIAYRKGFSDADLALEEVGLRGAGSEFVRGMRSLYEQGNHAWNEGDMEAAYQTLGDDVEYNLAPTWPEARPLRGRAEVVKFFEGLRETFPDVRAEPLEFEEISERRVILGFPVVGTGRASGVRIDMEIWQVWELTEIGLPKRVHEYLEREAALRAAGIAG